MLCLCRTFSFVTVEALFFLVFRPYVVQSRVLERVYSNAGAASVYTLINQDCSVNSSWHAPRLSGCYFDDTTQSAG